MLMAENGKMKSIRMMFGLIASWMVMIFMIGCTSNQLAVDTTPAETEISTVGAAITFTDALTHTITLKAPAQRVISLAPASTEILFAVGAGAQMVGRDQVSDYPEEVKKIKDVGANIQEINLEAVAALEPDLVLASGLIPSDQVKSMQDLGLNVFVLGNPDDLEGMYQNVQIVGGLTGHDAEAAALIQILRERVAVVEARVKGVSERPLVYYELDASDPNAPWTPGPGTFIDRLIYMAGGRNVGSVLKTEWAQISLEELLLQDPDLILLGDTFYGGVTPESVKGRAGWQALKAVVYDQVKPFDDNLVSRPGPRLVDGLEELAKLLHPELFQ